MTHEKRFQEFIKSNRPSPRVIAILQRRGALPHGPPWTAIAVGEGCDRDFPAKAWTPDRKAEGTPEGA
jgi:hypothetical protein